MQRACRVECGDANDQPHRRPSSNVPRAGAFAFRRELLVERQHDGGGKNGADKAQERPGVEVEAEQRRAVAGIVRHDVQEDLAGGDGGAHQRRDDDEPVVRRLRTMADGEDRPDRQRREGDALQQAQRARQLVVGELPVEGEEEHRRNGVKRQGVQADRELRGHIHRYRLAKMTRAARPSRDADRVRR